MAEQKKRKAIVKAVAPAKDTEALVVKGMDENGNVVPMEISFPTPEAPADVYSKEMVTELNKRTKTIKDSIGKIDTSFEKIAFALYWIYDNNAYKAKGCDNIIAFAKKEFGYQKSTCYSLMNVVEAFAERDEAGKIVEKFREEVKGFSVSKLSLMVGLSSEEIKELSPSITVNEIKKYVKSLEGKELPELSEGNGNSEDTEAEEDIVDVDAVEVDSEYPLRSSCFRTVVCDADGNELEKPFIGIIDTAYIADMITYAHQGATVMITVCPAEKAV